MEVAVPILQIIGGENHSTIKEMPHSKNPDLIRQSEAVKNYGFPAPTLNKYYKNKKLWSEKEGRHRYYKRQELSNLSQSLASIDRQKHI